MLGIWQTTVVYQSSAEIGFDWESWNFMRTLGARRACGGPRDTHQGLQFRESLLFELNPGGNIILTSLGFAERWGKSESCGPRYNARRCLLPCATFYHL